MNLQRDDAVRNVLRLSHEAVVIPKRIRAKGYCKPIICHGDIQPGS
jgi:hypothetical protein